jgi:transposase
MLDNAKNLPNEPAALKGLVTSLASEVKSQALLIEKLRHQLAGMRQHRFGSHSEALDQLALRLEDEEIAASAQDPVADDANTDQEVASKGKPRRKPLPDHLPRSETTLSPGMPAGNAAVR